MDADAFGASTERIAGNLLVDGRAKQLHEDLRNEEHVVVSFKGEGAGGVPGSLLGTWGRPQLANATTCRVFQFLNACGIPVAYLESAGPTSFVARKCRMLPFRVIVRREARGSFLDRHPHVTQGRLLPQLVVECLLEASSRQWNGLEPNRDGALVAHTEGSEHVQLFDATRPGSTPFLVLPALEFFASQAEKGVFFEVRDLARQVFLVLERAWQLEGHRLQDLTLEFGLDAQGRLRLADSIDEGSWSVVENAGPRDEQPLRHPSPTTADASPGQGHAELTARFRVPRQRIILWRGSDTDNVEPFSRALGELAPLMTVVTCSAHKEPVAAATTLQQMVQDVPDSVVIAYIGRSNGAGPTLSATSTVPVITVPANAKEFPEDVWSSLRAPSKVPVMTVLEPSNAVLAALQILSLRNPRVYAKLRAELETRMINVVPLGT